MRTSRKTTTLRSAIGLGEDVGRQLAASRQRTDGAGAEPHADAPTMGPRKYVAYVTMRRVGADRAICPTRLWVGGRVGPVERGASIDELLLLHRAVAAINRWDRAAASVLAGQVLSV